MLRKFLCIGLSVILLMGCLAGCTGSSQNTENSSKANSSAPKEDSSKTAESSKEEQKEELVYPKLSEETVELSWFYPIGETPLTWIESYSDSPTVQELEKRTNVKFDWYNCYVDAREEKYNLMLASDEMTDLITHRFMQFTNYITGDRAIEEGNYLRLNEMIDEYMPNYKALLESDYDAYLETVTDTGNIWAFYLYADPNGYYAPDCSGLAYRKDIADACGLTETPETLDEWEAFFDVLIEHGYEHPFLISENGLSNSNTINGAFGVSHTFYHEGDTVKYGPAEEGYRQYVTRMNEWINKGYAYRDFATQDTWESMSSGNTVVSWMTSYFIGDTAAAWMGPDFFIQPAPDPSLTKGDTVHLHALQARMSNPTAVTTACETPDIACKLVDYLYSDEGVTLCNYGVEGVTYEVKDGEPDYTDFMLHHTETSLLAETMETYALLLTTRDLSLGNKYSDKNIWAAEIMFKNTDNAYELPLSLNMTADEMTEFSAIMADVETSVKENIVKFILGDRPLDEWDAYVATLKEMKLDRAVELKQASYDRYMAGRK